MFIFITSAEDAVKIHKHNIFVINVVPRVKEAKLKRLK